MDFHREMSPEALQESLRAQLADLEKNFTDADAEKDTTRMNELEKEMRLLREQLDELEQQKAA